MVAFAFQEKYGNSHEKRHIRTEYDTP